MVNAAGPPHQSLSGSQYHSRACPPAGWSKTNATHSSKLSCVRLANWTDCVLRLLAPALRGHAVANLKQPPRDEAEQEAADVGHVGHAPALHGGQRPHLA